MTLKQEAIRLLLDKSVLHLDEPVELASGKMSSVFVDVKAGLSESADLRLLCAALNEQLSDAGVVYDAVGGPTMGADHLAVGMALEQGCAWFFVRKEAKGRGTARQIEGASLAPGMRVVVVEDAVSTGGSMVKAIEVIERSGATIAAVTTPIDRGTSAAVELKRRNLPYFPLATYAELGLAAV